MKHKFVLRLGSSHSESECVYEGVGCVCMYTLLLQVLNLCVCKYECVFVHVGVGIVWV